MTKAVFFGASSVAGVGASSPERRYTTLMCRALGWEEINLGLAGSGVVGRDDAGQVVDDSSAIARVPDVLDAAPDVLFIQYGGIDFSAARPLGDPERFRQGTFLWDYDTALRGLREGLPDTQVILSTMPYRADALTPNALGLTLQDYNDAVRRLGARYGLRVLDAYADAGIDAGNFARLSADTAHLNDEGYERLAGFYIERLRTG